MSDRRSTSGKSGNRFDPLPNTDTDTDMGDLGTGGSAFGVGATNQPTGVSGRSGGTSGEANAPTLSAKETGNLTDKTTDPTRFSDSQGGTSSGKNKSSNQNSGTMGKAKDAADTAQHKAKEAMDTAQHKAKDAVSDVQSKATEMGEQATSKADMGIDKAAGGLDTIATTLRDKGQSMGDGQIGHMATMAADKLEHGAEMLRSKDSEQMVDELEAMIRRRPVESLLVAVGAGYLLSRAL